MLKKTICIDARMIHHSGIGTYLRNILARLQNSAYQISVLIDPKTVDKTPFLGSFRCIELPASIYSIREQLNFPRSIPSCDLFWSPHYNIPLLPIRAKKRVVTIHDVYHLAFIHRLDPFQKIYAKLMLKQAVARSDHIFTVSQFSAGEIIKYTRVTQEKITPIHLGVDISHFYPRKNSELSENVKQKYRLPDRYLLFVSNLAFHKNIQGLLVAWDILNKEFPDWKLVIAGKNVNGITLPMNQGVLFLGEVANEDLPILYENAHATVLPSFYEGFGLTPLEAMSCGCPVAASKIGSLEEVLSDAALYFDPHQPREIAQSLKTLMTNPDVHQRLKIKGLNHISRFSWDKTVSKHLEIIEMLL